MSTASKHGKACVRYKQWFLDQHGYGFCEACGRSDVGLDTHHIYYASRYPKHPNLHDFRNLILVCRACHDKFHGGQYEDLFLRIEEERGLKALFL